MQNRLTYHDASATQWCLEVLQDISGQVFHSHKDQHNKTLYLETKSQTVPFISFFNEITSLF